MIEFGGSALRNVTGAKFAPVYAEVAFKAENNREMLELDNSEIAPGARIGLHYVSVLSFFEE